MYHRTGGFMRVNYTINDIEVEVEVDDVQWSNDSIGAYEYGGAHEMHQVEDHISDFNIIRTRIIGNADEVTDEVSIQVDVENYDFHSDDDFIRKLENLAYDF